MFQFDKSITDSVQTQVTPQVETSETIQEQESRNVLYLLVYIFR